MDQLTFVGTAASVAGVAIGVIGILFGKAQAVRLQDLRRRTSADIWKMITSAQAVRGELEMANAFKQNDPQIRQVYGRVVEYYRDLLKMATLDEDSFTEDTIQKWRSTGRLQNDWEVSQARKYLPTSQIRYEPMRDSKSASAG